MSELMRLMRGVEAITNNVDGYQLWEDLYEGNVGEIFASQKMRAVMGEYGDQFRVNLAKIPVNVMADRCEIAAITVPDSEADTKELQESVWDANELLMRSKTWIRKTSQYGDGYLFVWESEDEDGNADGVSICFNNPKTTRVIYDPETETKSEYAIKLWAEGTNNERIYRANLYYADHIERWVTKKDKKPSDPQAWERYVEDDETGDDWEIQNPYGIVPIFHLRNDEPYGFPEHQDALGPQNMINKSRASRASGMDFQMYPQRWGIKDPGTLGEDEDDGIDWDEDDENASSAARQNYSKLKGGAGEFWNLEGFKAVGQFDPAPPSVFLDPEKQEIKLMSCATSTPMHFFETEGDQPSGESRRAANEPVEKKAKDRMQRYGSTLSKAFSFALHVVQKPGTPYTKENAKKVDVRWASAGIVSDLEGWQTIEKKVENGVPLRFALLEAGYTAEQCDAWGITNEMSDVPMRRQIEILTELAQALQGLGTGVSLEILDAEDVKQIVDRVVTAASAEDEDAA